MTRLFGTDGVRGKANRELTPQMAFDLGKAGAFYLSKGEAGSFFVIGKDTRLSGDMLEGALIAGINSVGGDVIRAGVITTPGIACVTKELGATGGVMISASHNPFDDNGIKFFNSGGFKLDDAEEEEIEALYFNSLQGLPCPVGDCVGSEKRVANPAELYLSFLKKAAGTSFTGMRVVLDCANGAAYRLAPRLFRELGARVEV
ncbi:MAG TPA: phosphoglucosamine mutase, partial [Firmicutes bacterium]|nr:phosphoglucosamine mutase [Bacillota bacterium]